VHTQREITGVAPALKPLKAPDDCHDHDFDSNIANNKMATEEHFADRTQ